MQINYCEVGRRIKKKRLERQFSQERLAELTEISPQYLGAIENGRKAVSLNVICKISEVLELTIDEILYGRNRIPIDQYCADLELLLVGCTKKEARIVYDVSNALLESIRENE